MAARLAYWGSDMATRPTQLGFGAWVWPVPLKKEDKIFIEEIINSQP
jgi:hypothetical protein